MTTRTYLLILLKFLGYRFLSAFNYYDSKSPDVANRTDPDGNFAWIDNYCAAHPLDSIATATIALVSELSQRAGARQ